MALLVFSGPPVLEAVHFPEEVGWEVRGSPGPRHGRCAGGKAPRTWCPCTPCSHPCFPGPGPCEAPAGAQPDPPHTGTMFRKKKKKRPEISAPRNFQHRVHTSFDPKEGKFVGLPPQWQNILDTLRRPKPVVDPSRITRVQLQPMKVRWGVGMVRPSSASPAAPTPGPGQTTKAPGGPT